MCCIERQGCHGQMHHGNDMQGTCECGGMRRKYLSRNERIEMLEEYLHSLKNEMEGVGEEIKELKGKRSK